MFKPINDRILIEPDPTREETSFGLVLPEAKDKPVTGLVVVGSKKIPKGKKVLFSKYGFDELVHGKKTYYVVSEANVLGLFE